MSIPNDYLTLLDRIQKVEDKLTSLIPDTNHPKNGYEHASSPEVFAAELQTSKTPLVMIQSKAYLKMALHAKKYANKDIKQRKWVEVIGLLTGRIINENTPLEQILVTDAWPVGHGDAVSVSIMESRSFTDVIQKAAKNEYIVGWYHSHPSYGNFLSIDDYNTQARYQSLWDKSIALVIDPTEISSTNYGFEVFRNTHPESEDLRQSYSALTSDVGGSTTSSAFDILSLIQPALKGKTTQYFEY